MVFTGLNIPPKDPNMAKSRVVLLWAREDLLGRAVQQLLNKVKDWQITRIYDETHGDILARELERLQPDVLIIHRGDYSGSSMNTLRQLMLGHCEMKIITISPEKNLVEVYDKHTICIKGVSDLLSVIEEGHAPGEQGGESSAH